MCHRPRPLRVGNPKLFLRLPLLRSSSHRHARSLRTSALDYARNFTSESRLSPRTASGLPPLYRRAYRILGNAADAEDTVQNALLAAYTHLHRFRGQAQISTWLTTIMLNCARLQLRWRAKHVQVSLDESTGGPQPVSVSERLADQRPNPEDEYRKSELSTHLTHLHSQLSPTLRRTFQLRDVDGLSIRETAQILGVPTGTVKAQSTRARQKLKELMRRTLRLQYRRLPSRLLEFVSATSRN